MIKIAYGRFELPHWGHKSLAKHVDQIILSHESPIPLEVRCLRLNQIGIEDVNYYFSYFGVLLADLQQDYGHIELHVGEDRYHDFLPVELLFNCKVIKYPRTPGLSSSKVENVALGGGSLHPFRGGLSPAWDGLAAKWAKENVSFRGGGSSGA